MRSLRRLQSSMLGVKISLSCRSLLNYTDNSSKLIDFLSDFDTNNFIESAFHLKSAAPSYEDLQKQWNKTRTTKFSSFHRKQCTYCTILWVIIFAATLANFLQSKTRRMCSSNLPPRIINISQQNAPWGLFRAHNGEQSKENEVFPPTGSQYHNLSPFLRCEIYKIPAKSSSHCHACTITHLTTKCTVPWSLFRVQTAERTCGRPRRPRWDKRGSSQIDCCRVARWSALGMCADRGNRDASAKVGSGLTTFAHNHVQ